MYKTRLCLLMVWVVGTVLAFPQWALAYAPPPTGEIRLVARDYRDQLVPRGEMWVEVGPSVTPDQVISMYGKRYEEVTGTKLDHLQLQAANKGPNIILRCERSDGRQQWSGTEVDSWTESCPMPLRRVAFIAGLWGRIKIPEARNVTAEEQAKAGREALVCQKDPACLARTCLAQSECVSQVAQVVPPSLSSTTPLPNVQDALIDRSLPSPSSPSAPTDMSAIQRLCAALGALLGGALFLIIWLGWERAIRGRVIRALKARAAKPQSSLDSLVDAKGLQTQLEAAQTDVNRLSKHINLVATFLDVRNLPNNPGPGDLERVLQNATTLATQLPLAHKLMRRAIRAAGANAPTGMVPTQDLGDNLRDAIVAQRQMLAAAAILSPTGDTPPSFAEIAAVLADRERLVREERAQLVSNHEAVVLERDAAHTRFNDLQQVVDETFRRARKFAKVAQEWVGADACSVPTELAQVPQVTQSINVVFAQLDGSLRALSEELGSRYYCGSLTLLQNLNLLKTWILSEQTTLASEREAEERFRAGLTRLCAVDEEGVVFDRARLVDALQERIDLHDGNLNALALAERRLLARSIVGWPGESGTDPGSLQDLVRAAQSFARDARRFEGEIGRAIQDGATALHVDLDKAQPLKDQLKRVLAAAVTAVAPKSPATLAQEFMDACGHRVHDELTALKLLLGYDFGAENGAAPDSNKTGVQSLRDNPGVARTLVRWVMADFSGPNDPSISTAVAAQ